MRIKLISSQKVFADSMLFLMAVIWGSTYLVIKNILPEVRPVNFTFWRFLIAAGVLALAFFPRLKKISFFEFSSGLVLGVFLGLGFIFQTIGLEFTDTGKAGFITGFYIALVPVFSFFLLGMRLRKPQVLGIAAALLGLGFLSIDSQFRIQLGDLLIFFSAVMFAFQIVGVHYVSKKANPDLLKINVIQTVTVGIVAFLGAYLFEKGTPIPPQSALGVLVFSGVVATAVCLILQMRFQPLTLPSHAALILSLEAVVAALVGFQFGHEAFGLAEIIGSLLMISGTLIVELA